MSVKLPTPRLRGWAAQLLSFVTGIVLLALDVLPLLVWAAVIACLDRMMPGPLSRALVLGTFFAAIALTVVTAPKIHRLTHALAGRGQRSDPNP